MKTPFLPLLNKHIDTFFYVQPLCIFILMLIISLQTSLAQVVDFTGDEAGMSRGGGKAQRAYSGSHVTFYLDEETQGYVKKVSGGSIKAEVVSHDLGPDHIVKKHLASAIIYEPITIEVGMGMSNKLKALVNASFRGEFPTVNGSIIASYFTSRSQSKMEFQDAHISQVTIPALDASSKEPAYMTIKLDPEQIRYLPGDGNVVKKQGVRKTWQASGFRIELGDLPCERVSKIDSFTWKQGVVKDEVGEFRTHTMHPAKVEVPNIKLTISMVDIEPWIEWHKCFVIDGNCADEDELSGSITFLGPDLKEELGRLELRHVGISSISLLNSTQKANKNKEQVARFEVEIYLEGLGFDLPEIDDEVLLRRRSKD